MKKIFFYDTMIGRVGIAAEENAVTELILPLSGEKPSGKQETGSEDLKRAGQKEAEIAETPLIRLAFMQLSEYLAGKRKEFSLPLEPEGTEFQKKVWRALAEIPYGTTRSYREIAKETGNEKAARAVGMANNKNPIPIFIPCHRVISSDGSMAGYYGGIAGLTAAIAAASLTAANDGVITPVSDKMVIVLIDGGAYPGTY